MVSSTHRCTIQPLNGLPLFQCTTRSGLVIVHLDFRVRRDQTCWALQTGLMRVMGLCEKLNQHINFFDCESGGSTYQVKQRRTTRAPAEDGNLCGVQLSLESRVEVIQDPLVCIQVIFPDVFDRNTRTREGLAMSQLIRVNQRTVEAADTHGTQQPHLVPRTTPPGQQEYDASRRW